jgi:hypothetical protein
MEAGRSQQPCTIARHGFTRDHPDCSCWPTSFAFARAWRSINPQADAKLRHNCGARCRRRRTGKGPTASCESLRRRGDARLAHNRSVLAHHCWVGDNRNDCALVTPKSPVVNLRPSRAVLVPGATQNPLTVRLPAKSQPVVPARDGSSGPLSPG